MMQLFWHSFNITLSYSMGACCLLALVSLITPRAALLCKDKTRLKGFLSWLGVALACFLIVTVLVQTGRIEIKKEGQSEEVPISTSIQPQPDK
jgi:hypothetical protein